MQVEKKHASEFMKAVKQVDPRARCGLHCRLAAEPHVSVQAVSLVIRNRDKYKSNPLQQVFAHFMRGAGADELFIVQLSQASSFGEIFAAISVQQQQ